MENLEIYNRCREVPKEAQKAIAAGRLRGKTDINPMWRIKKLTELFGPAGTGWKFDPPVFEEKQGAKGEIVVHCFTCLYVRQDDGQAWSAPIPGVGGSTLVTMERDGLRTDDDAYKKAYTDAQSVACKALGIGADISGTLTRPSMTHSQPLLHRFVPAVGSRLPVLHIMVKKSVQSRRRRAAKRNTGVFFAWNAPRSSPKKRKD